MYVAKIESDITMLEFDCDRIDALYFDVKITTSDSINLWFTLSDKKTSYWVKQLIKAYRQEERVLYIFDQATNEIQDLSFQINPL